MKAKKIAKSFVNKNKKTLVKLLLAAFIIFVLSFISIFIKNLFDKSFSKKYSISHLEKQWAVYNYKEVYDISSEILATKPFHNKALTYKGYSSFFLALSSTDSLECQNLLDESIVHIRLALQSAKPKLIPQLEYMLGKAYFFKDNASSFYYYADLAVYYLKNSLDHGYKADDTYEYLGLSYASLDMPMESISAFSQALLTRESDLLLLSIAEQYYKAKGYDSAVQYLFRISQNCNDEKITDKSHLILGKIYTEQKKYKDAEKEFLIILENKENSADAYYGLGVIYESMGDTVKARAYWRKALKVQLNHPESLKKLSEFK